MLTHAATTTPFTTDAAGRRATQKVLIVNGDSDVLHLLEPVLEAGNYDIVFVEASAHAYSQIRRVRPDLVILCLRIDEADGFQVLSMVKLDPDTRDIPLVTYTAPTAEEAESNGDEQAGEDEADDAQMFPVRPAPPLMN